jgi:hypothetical protein
MLIIAEHSYRISLNASDMCLLAYHWVLILSCTQVSSTVLVKNAECYLLRVLIGFKSKISNTWELSTRTPYRDGEGE